MIESCPRTPTLDLQSANVTANVPMWKLARQNDDCTKEQGLGTRIVSLLRSALHRALTLILLLNANRLYTLEFIFKH